MVRVRLTTIAAAAAVAIVVQAQQASPPDNAPVVLDVSVRDQQSRPVSDLQQHEFQIEEDGKRYPVANYAHVTLRGSPNPGDNRSLMLILDDSGVPPGGTGSIQAIASLFIANLNASDNVSVIRLHTIEDSLATSREQARSRIAAYRAGIVPFVQSETPENLLRLVTTVSRQREKITPRRRHAIVCIGSQAVCSPSERDPTAPRDLYSNWVAALTTAARSHAVVYATVPGRAALTGGSVLVRTGGELFAGSLDYNAAARRVVSDISDYYLLGYTPEPSKRDLRSVSVVVARQGVRVHARERR